MNVARSRLAEGKPVAGLWSLLPHAALNEMIGLAGFHFQILDMEHGPYDFGSLDTSIRACEVAGVSPWVRIDGLNSVSTQRALDLGAHGILFPQVRNYDEAKQAAAFAKYPPRGVRGFNPFTRVSDYTLRGARDNRNADGFATVGILVENLTAWKDLPKILEIPDIDVVYLGAYDMSVALGAPGDMAHPELRRFLHESIPQIRAAGKAAGVMAKTKEECADFVARGANVIVSGVDTLLIGHALKGAVADFQTVTGK